MAEYVDFTLTFTDNSSGDKAEDGTEVQIYTDSPSYKPTVKIDYAAARHAWMALPLVNAGVTTLPIRLKFPVTFIKVRVRQFNEHGPGEWNFPGGASGTQFDFAPDGQPTNTPNAPTNVGVIVTGTPTPPVDPPVDPPPPPPPTGGGGASSNYAFTAQYSGVQEQDQWSYLDENDVPMTYSSADAIWNGSQAYMGIWNGGAHPGISVGAKLRWTAPSGGTAIVTGSAQLLASTGTFGVTLNIKKNGVAVGSYPVSLTTTTPQTINETIAVTTGQTIDFIVAGISGNSYCSTALTPLIQFTTDGSTPAPPTFSTFTPATASVNPGGIAVLTITLSSVTPTAATVTLASSTGNTTVPASVTISAGSRTASVLVTGVSVGASTITATYNGIDKTAVVSVQTSTTSTEWANAPAGGVVLLDHSFSTIQGVLDIYSSTTIMQDTSAPFSPPWVGRHRLEAFAREGGGQTQYASAVHYRELYVGMWWRCNAQWQGRTVQDKLFFVRGLDGTNTGSNGLFEFIGGPRKGGPMRLIWAHNSGNVINTHLVPGQTGENLDPNVGPGIVIPGLWTKLEAHVRCSTTTTSRDGFVRWWINGAPAGNYSGNNYGAATTGLFEWVWTETWDRSGDMGTSNTVAWEHYVDHVIMIGKN